MANLMDTTLAARPTSPCDVLDRVPSTGVVAVGELVITVADVDLIYVGLHVTLTSVETAHKHCLKLGVQEAALLPQVQP